MSDEDYEQGFSEGYDQGLSTDKEKSFLILAARIDELKNEITCLRAELAAVTAERDRMQHRLDAAYNVIDKDIKNDMAFAEKHADLWLENERLREALKPFADEFRLYKTDFPDHFYISDLGFTFGQLRAAAAALEGVTEKSGAENE